MTAAIETIPAEKVASAIQALVAAHNRELARLRADHATKLDRLLHEARMDARAEGVRAGVEAYRRGSVPVAILEADEHRDLSARIAEYRTRCLAVEITWNDPDGAFFVTAQVKAKHYWPVRFRLEKTFTSKDEAVEFFDRIVSKFGGVAGFTCRVDY